MLFAAAVLAMLTHAALAQDEDQVAEWASRGAEAAARSDWAAAADAYAKVVRAQPENGGAWFRLGYAYHAGGDLKNAIPAHKRAAEFPQIAPIALYNLGCAYALTGEKDKAFAALKKSVAAGMNDVNQLKQDSDLKSLHGDPRFEQLVKSLSGATGGNPQRQFDFWVGDWVVHNQQGRQVGVNRISKLENGHIIFEEWTSAGGGSGKSMNYYDPADKKWKQLWVDARGGVVRYAGEFKNGAMHFTGVYIAPDGTTEIARSSFTPRPDGSVRQFIEHSKDDGENWYVYFDGVYTRRGAAPVEHAKADADKQ